MGGAITRENFLRWVALQLCGGEQQMLSGNVFIFKVIGFFEGAIQQLVRGLRQSGLRGGP